MQITADMLRTHIANLTAIRDRARAEADQASGAIQMCEALLQTLDKPGDLGSDAPGITIEDLLAGATIEPVTAAPPAVEAIGGHLRPNDFASFDASRISTSNTNLGVAA